MQMEKIDWSECTLVETTPDVMSGAVVLRGTRMPAESIVDNFDYGLRPSEIAEQFELGLPEVEGILHYAESHRLARPLR